MRGSVIGAIVGVWAAAMPARAETDADVATLVGWMTGEFNTRAQVERLGPDKARLRVAFATKLDMPNVPGTATFVEWRDPDADGPVTSQRIWTYTARPDGIAMHFYTLNERARAALTGVRSAADPRAAAAKGLALGDLHGYPEACTFLLTKTADGYRGRNGTGDCVIFNRALGTNMRPTVIMTITEAGYTEDGTFAYEAVGTTPAKTERIVQEFKRVR
jgi:hypothetical protein